MISDIVFQSIVYRIPINMLGIMNLEYVFIDFEIKLFNIPSFAFVQSREMEQKHVSSQPVYIQKYVER